MKTILSRRQDSYQMTVPMRGGYSVNFAGGRASVSDDVADALVMLGAGFYSLAEGSGNMLQAGSRILVIRDMGLGDLLLITPLLRHLAAQGVQVDVQTLARYRCLFDGNSSVQRTFSLEEDVLEAGDYACVLDLRLFVENEENSGRHQHRIDGFASAADVVIGSEAPARKLDYFPAKREVAAARARLQRVRRAARRGLVAYVWRASTETRSWSAETQHQMVAALVLAGWGVVILDQEPQGTDLIGSTLLNLSGCLSIRETAAVMSSCDVVLTPDTGLFHLAGALDLPTVAYFGAFPAAERQMHQSLTVLNTPGNCGLFPCRAYRCLNRGTDGQPRCLSLSPQEVVQALRMSIISREMLTTENNDGTVLG